jgi:hypothetical protein
MPGTKVVKIPLAIEPRAVDIDCAISNSSIRALYPDEGVLIWRCGDLRLR